MPGIDSCIFAKLSAREVCRKLSYLPLPWLLGWGGEEDLGTRLLFLARQSNLSVSVQNFTHNIYCIQHTNIVTVTFEKVSVAKHTKRQVFLKMRLFTMFITAICVLF